MIANSTLLHSAGSQEFEQYPLPSLLPGVSDSHLLLVLPILVHWVTSACFELIERGGWFEKYRLHTSAEELLRNKVTRRDCFVNTVRCQFLQVLLGIVLTWNSPGETSGNDGHDIAVWSLRVHATLSAIPEIMSLSGIKFTSMGLPVFATNFLNQAGMSSFDLEKLGGGLLHWYLVPAAQLAWAVLVADAWMYFLHRFEHTNKWLYSE